MSSATMYVGGKPVYVYSYNPRSGLRAVFQYRETQPKASTANESAPYLDSCSFFDTYEKSAGISAFHRIFSPIAKFMASRSRRLLESKLSALAGSSFDWSKIQMLNVTNAVHLVFIDYLSTDGAHLVYPSVHLYERMLSDGDLASIFNEQLSKMPGDVSLGHTVAA